MTTDVNALAEKIIGLSTAKKLWLAIGLLEKGIGDERVESIIKAALDDLQAQRLLGISRAPLR